MTQNYIITNKTQVTILGFMYSAQVELDKFGYLPTVQL